MIALAELLILYMLGNACEARAATVPAGTSRERQCWDGYWIACTAAERARVEAGQWGAP